MYERYFHLTERPFSLTPDPGFLFLSASHQQALDHLMYGLETGEGFIVMTGDIGVGKTTVCRALLARLSGSFTTALVLNPMLTEKELIRGILDDFSAGLANGTKKDCLDALNRFLLAEAESGRRPVLIVDEAQNLSPSLLEQVRLLSNLETEKRKLLQIVLIGQKELKEKLSLPSLRQLNQRVTVRAEILPLTRKETSRYIDHRLGVAGGAGRTFLSAGAERAIFRHSGGVPRRINMLCDRAFLSAYLRGGAEIGRKDVREAAESLSDNPGMAKRFLRLVSRVSYLFLFLAAWAICGGIG
jgi:general secretion pathway protein A